MHERKAMMFEEVRGRCLGSRGGVGAALAQLRSRTCWAADVWRAGRAGRQDRPALVRGEVGAGAVLPARLCAAPTFLPPGVCRGGAGGGGRGAGQEESTASAWKALLAPIILYVAAPLPSRVCTALCPACLPSQADAFVTIPGGFGTLDETLEITTWQQVGAALLVLILFKCSTSVQPQDGCRRTPGLRAAHETPDVTTQQRAGDAVAGLPACAPRIHFPTPSTRAMPCSALRRGMWLGPPAAPLQPQRWLGG